MKINSAKYFAREAFKNVFSNGWMSLASVFTVVASLLVFGLFTVMILNLNFMVTQMESDYEITLTVDETFTNEQTANLASELHQIENVSEVIFESKDARMSTLRERFGENASLLDNYQNEENPLRHWYKIRCIDLTKSSETVAEIKQLDGVVSVISNGETIKKLTSASDYIGKISIWIMLALTVVSVFIISNTIKLAVFSRRKEINIMKFVGATDWFIRWPFIIEGVLIGILGSVIASIFVCVGYNGLVGMFAALNISIVRFIPMADLSFWLTFILIIMGIALGVLGSFIAVRKHLKV